MSIIPAGQGAGNLRCAEHLLQLFRGREDVIAVASGKIFHPETLATPLTAKRLATEHLSGQCCLGFYLMMLENNVLCSCIDLDNKPDRPDPAWRKKTERIHRFLSEHHLDSLVEISQSGSAAHIWNFFSEPVPARTVRPFWRGVLSSLGISPVEIFPKQDELTGKGLGNLIRYPLWNRSCFVDVAAGWKPLRPLAAMSSTSSISINRLSDVAKAMGFSLMPAPAPTPARPRTPARKPTPSRSTSGSNDLPPRVQRMLNQGGSFADRWNGDTVDLIDTSRSAVVMSFACMLVRKFIPTPEIEAAIRSWCAEHDYEKGDRDDWIDGVIEKAYDFVASGGDTTSHLPPDTPAIIQASFARVVRKKVEKKLGHKHRGARS